MALLTRITSATKEVLIGDDRPTVLIGERINPTGRRRLAAALADGDWEAVRKEAIAQAQAGADVLDVNVGVPGLDETKLLPEAVRVVAEAVDLPICIDSNNPQALAAALAVYRGKALVNSVTGEPRSLQAVLPVVRDFGACVIGLAMDEGGIPREADRRVAIASRIVERAEAAGIPREDVVIDCLAMAVGADGGAALVTLEAMRRVRAELGVNLSLGASNISFGMPDRVLLTGAFLALTIASGLNCPIVDAARVRPVVTAVDLLLGRDPYARRYVQAYRARQNPA
ncbi:MAG: dihydropteroate synthase [bacterium]